MYTEQCQQQLQANLVQFLPQSIRADILVEMRAPLFCEHTLFQHMRKMHRSMLKHVCHHVASTRLWQTDDQVFAQGEHCTSMLFVDKGILSYELSDEMHNLQLE